MDSSHLRPDSAHAFTSTRRNKPRGADGRFRASKIDATRRDPRASHRLARNRRYRAQRRNAQEEYFSGYVGVFFVPGEQRDFIPFSSRSGPFVEVFEDIIKDKYLLGRNERSTTLQKTYEIQGLLGNPTQLVRICTCDAATPDACKSRVKVYRYRRFPCLTRTTSEMNPLIEWLKRLSGLGVLSFSWRESLSVCVEAIKKYKYLSNKEAGYVGFPLESSQQLLTGSSERAHVVVRTQNVGGALQRQGVEGENGKHVEPLGNGSSAVNYVGIEGSRDPPIHIRESGDGALTSSGALEVASTSTGTTLRSESLSHNSLLGGPNDDMLRFMMHYLELSYCDDVFLVLCMLFDERLDSKFQFVVGAFREKYKNGQVVAPLLVKNIMAYAHAKAFDTNAGHDHSEIERSLKRTRDQIATVRSLYGLKSYEEMRWVDPDQN